MSVSCGRDDCSKTWERDPVLEVACPSCRADVGQQCQRPSGWKGPFVDVHKGRDLRALAEGHYGECPKGRCPESLEELERGATQAALQEWSS